MLLLPRAILFDLDDTILSFGRRALVIEEIAERAPEWFAPLTPRTAAAAMEARFKAFWADQDRHKAWRPRLAQARRMPQRGKIERFDLARRFDHIQIEGDHGFGKPEERAYRHAMQVLSVAPHETWIVGDNLEWEVIAPQKLGIHSIWYDPHGDGIPAGHAAKPNRIIRSLTELLA